MNNESEQEKKKDTDAFRRLSVAIISVLYSNYSNIRKVTHNKPSLLVNYDHRLKKAYRKSHMITFMIKYVQIHLQHPQSFNIV